MQSEKSPENKVVAFYGRWCVRANGEIYHLVHKKVIQPDCIRKSDWWLDLRSCYWMADQWNDFMPAWAKACELAGINEINIKTQL